MQHSVERIRLSNGAEGLFIDTPNASVFSIDIVFRAGDYLSPKRKTDTAHITEHMVLGANKRYPDNKEFSREFTKFGATNNAYTGDYHMGYEAECEASEVVRIIDMLCAAIEAPLLTHADFIAEKGNVREELKMRRNNEDSELGLQLEHMMGFVPKSYANRTKELEAITLEDIRAHYSLTHTSSNMRFVIAGPLQQYRQHIHNRLQALLLQQGNGYIALPNEQPRALSEPYTMINNNLENVCYRWETVLPRFANSLERHSLHIVHDVLFNGFHSRVFGELREKGLVYGIFGSNYDTKNNDVSVINGQVQASGIVDVFRILLRELHDISQDGVGEEELQEAKQRGFGEAQRFYQTVGQLAGWYRHAFIMRDEVELFSDMKEKVFAVTVESTKLAARRMLETSISGLGIMHNKNDHIQTDTLQHIIRP